MLEIFKAKPIDLSALKIDNEVKKKRIMNEFNMLTKMQQFFSEMAMTSKKYLDPSDILRNLVDSVGNKLTYGEEKDLFEINIGIIERLGECMMYTQRYYREDVSYLTSHIAEDEFGRGDKELGAVNEQNSYLSNSLYKVERSPIKNLLYGIKAEYTIDNDSDQSIPRLNDFLGLIINPIHQNLYNALNE